MDEQAIQPDNLELADGTDTPTQAEVQDSSTVEAIPASATPSQQFKSGNLEQLPAIQQNIEYVTSVLTKTVEPLIEAALIELLGNSGAYTRDEAVVSPSMMGSSFSVDVRMVFKVPLWIGDDINKDDVMHDAKYVLEKVKPVQDINWKTCSIDTTDGTLLLEFTITK